MLLAQRLLAQPYCCLATYSLQLIRDNSTRGLDAVNAIEFARTLRMSTELSGATACVSIYQASQNYLRPI